MKRILSVLLLTLLAACGAQKTSSLNVVASFAVSATSPAKVVAQQLDGPGRRSVSITTGSTKVDLPNGKWRIMAVTWMTADDGNPYTSHNVLPMEGDPQCALQDVTLTGAPTTVSLSMKRSNCMQEAFFPAGSYYQADPYSYFQGVTFKVCDPASTDATLANTSGCGAWSTGVTGVKVSLPDAVGDTVTGTGLEGQCTTSGSNNFFLNQKIPVGSATMYTLVEAFYGASGCSGSACCSGASVKYRYPNGFAQGASNARDEFYIYNSSNSSAVAELSPPTKWTANPAWSSGTAYNGSCLALTIGKVDSSSAPVSVAVNTSLAVACQSNSCAFYSGNTCTTLLGSSMTATVLTGMSTTTVYLKATSPKIKLTATGDTGVAPLSLTVPVSATFSQMDGTYLANGNQSDIPGVTYMTPPFVNGQNFVYRTYEGNVGKFSITSVTTTTDIGDSVTFDYWTYNGSTYNLLYNNSVNSTACFSSGNCFWNMDTLSATGDSSNNPGFTDFWWENLSGSLYFNPQGSASILYVP